ncbi:MAG: ABC transporter ATP-binding protein [Clostridia bacterium]|nr:ABC transporter ATP-binding protein [Clostridia bacterium]
MKKENTKKQPKRKPKYGMLSCIGYSLKATWTASKTTAIAAIIAIPVKLVLNAVGLYWPSIIVGSLEAHNTFSTIVSIILGITLARLILSLLGNFIDINKEYSEHFVVNEFYARAKFRERDMDRFLPLDEKNMEIINRSTDTASNNHSAGVHFISHISGLVLNILYFILFGTTIAMLHPVILAFLVAGCLVNYFVAKWQNKRLWRKSDEHMLVNKKINYFCFNVAGSHTYGKDIRLFNFTYFFDKLIGKLHKKWYDQEKSMDKNHFFRDFVGFLIFVLRDGLAYAYLIYKYVEGDISTAQFILFFTAISEVSGFISGIFNTWSTVGRACLGVSDFREYFDIKDKLNRGKGIPLPEAKSISIEFKNVSFKYPKGDKKILDNVSFKINAGEKVAIVGVNGAGKTTMTSLMCGLLIPDDGEVLLNGHSVFEYNRDEMYSMFSLVPQIFSILPLTIEENIAVADIENGDVIDEVKLKRCLEYSGLNEKIASLPKGVKTPLNREIYADGTDLSGGEMQKLLLARAMYRDAKVLILDEPTAALDPIAEDNMYRRYSEISNGKTSLFISHRLASTRFCDRIFFLDGAVISEVGTHSELIKKNGKYKELFDVQAKYYKEDVNNEK